MLAAVFFGGGGTLPGLAATLAAMCLIAFAFDRHPAYPLVLIANRDELHARAAAPAGPDPQYPDVHGGRDLEQGGSWLMVSRRGRLAAVTNVRVRPLDVTHPRLRGALVREFASGTIGRPASRMRARACALEPMARMASGDGPTKVRPACPHRSAKSAFSDRKP